jgi:3-hydroxymyristoyl/3-hydroxydecanoyl-(acyl carrier protein) dehydratase
MPADNAATFSREAVIAADHPCLDGHFPGNPVVPGVLLLDNIGRLVRQWKPGCRIAGIAQAKFHLPLRPEQRITITLTEQNPRHLKFECFREHEKIASGVLQIEMPS